MLAAGTMSEVVITDDDPVVRHLLTSVLAQAGYKVTGIASGTDCLSLFAECQAGSRQVPALLFLDLQLQDISGTEVLVSLKERGFSLPIVLLSAQSREEAEAAFPDAASATAFLSKPFTPDKAVQIARELIIAD